MTEVELAAAFTTVRVQREKLNEADDELAVAIRHVESTLIALRPGVSAEVKCPPTDPLDEPYYLLFGKLKDPKSKELPYDERWRVMWARFDDDEPQPLADMSRQIRADVFAKTADGPPAIDRLVMGVVEAVVRNVQEREVLLQHARALSDALVRLGYPKPSS